MPVMKDVLLEELHRLIEKREAYVKALKALDRDQHERCEHYQNVLAGIKEDIIFIRRALKANRVDFEEWPSECRKQRNNPD